MRSTAKDNLRFKSIFDLSNEELRERLRPTGEATVQKIWSQNGYFTYYDPALCPSSNYLIHEYKDRMELVRVDLDGSVHLIKTL